MHRLSKKIFLFFESLIHVNKYFDHSPSSNSHFPIPCPSPNCMFSF